VEDNAIRFESIAGHDPLDPTSASSAARDCVGGLRQGIRGLRIGVVEHFYREDLCAEAEISAGIDGALGLLTELGARVERVRMSPLPVWCACGETILQAESYAVHELWLRERPHDYSKVCRSKLLTGAFVPASKYIRAQQMRAVLREELKERMRSFDVLVTASGMDPPCRIDIDEDVARTYNRHARMPFNVTGSPAISIPIGLSRLGLPMGIQIAAKALDEPTLYRVAWAYCEAAGSTELCPPLFSPSDLTC